MKNFKDKASLSFQDKQGLSFQDKASLSFQDKQGLSFQDKKVAVVGFGIEGRDLVKFLSKKSAIITIFDKKSENELDFEGIDKNKVNLVCGLNYLSTGLSGFDIVFRSPGVYRFLPELVVAGKGGAEISSAIKLFFNLCPAKIIGVTGTKGKGTTSTLIYEIIKNSKQRVYLAGNIGKPYLELLPVLKTSDWVVLELSSAQLIDLHKSPNISVVLNITEDHLDWHKDRDEYVDAKKNIVNHQMKKDFAVINFDYATPRSFERYTKGKVFYFEQREKQGSRRRRGSYFSKSKRVHGCYVYRGKIILATGAGQYEIGDVNDLLLRGRHNWENVTAAICASSIAGASIKSIKKVVFSFRGLEHRLELVGKVGGVAFYNDSFATGPQPTIAAIKSFKEPTTVILGGFDKGLDYSVLGEQIVKRDNVKTILLIGDLAPKIKKALISARYKGRLLLLNKPKMAKIVKTAFTSTPKAGVVLLSPAAASFDMFEDYKERGMLFKKAVNKLKE